MYIPQTITLGGAVQCRGSGVANLEPEVLLASTEVATAVIFMLIYGRGAEGDVTHLRRRGACC
jgi:hypothetical protein